MQYSTANFIVSFFLGLIFCVTACDDSRKVSAPKIKLHQRSELTILHRHALSLKNYAQKYGFNAQLFFVVNLKIESGKKRFFVYNVKTKQVIHSCLVTHGSGRKNTQQVQFSNLPDSWCSSMGKYKIGAEYCGKFGTAFKLYGLDTTNSKAYDRAVVLHAHDCVPRFEVYPLKICESWGCPTVSPHDLTVLKKIINDSKKPVLLKIIYE